MYNGQLGGIGRKEVSMPTISTRVDDKTKSEAEKIAAEIGVPVSTAINIFLKRFIANRGFPFNVVSTNGADQKPLININTLDASVKRAVADPNNIGLSRQFTYLDQNTGQPITVVGKE